ncbi:MAG: glycoside hydrolase, partial [Halobacteriales archaeon]|nr:glycoside hydrolase [Halobacteriales archaeon]
ATWVSHDVATLPRTSPAEPNPYATDFPSASVDGNGTVYVAWDMDASGLPGVPPEEAAIYGVFVSSSRDGGATWTKPQLVSDPTKDARFPWMAAGAAGRVAVAWYESVHTVPGEVAPDQWNVRLWESITAGSASPKGVTVTLSASPSHLGSVCTSGTGCAVGDRSLGDFFEVAITREGQPVATWVSSKAGTEFGVAAQGGDIHFGGVASGTPLR